MRKAQKKQAEDFLLTLGKAHLELKKLIENKRNETASVTAQKLLEDCQQGAIELGNMIEASEGEGFVTVKMLEEYCELTYQIHEQLANEEVVNANKAYKNLRRLLLQIENSIKNDIKERREVVFLPYKASMWDSLESVWKAADEDEDCDAYVIPIPYYDKNPDGSFREMHYEGEQYPSYVPVTWYEDYDFAGRQPDAIYIHNPYDECNYVTSVHPFFYSKNLKQFTEKLVYIPYFILEEISPNDQKTIDGMKHFCTTPGVIHADKVIVQSEDMRQIYINVLTETMGETAENRRYWEEKIDGTGSPKVDKVLNTRKEDLKIPEEWMKVIQKPDGSSKKIVFYNTGINGVLHYNEQMFVKIRDVFRVFKENESEVALLWRPHPLIESTLTSMRPQLWEEYQNLRDQYIAEGWGIYDDTSDMDRAVCLSDAYYGDGSSVVPLFLKTGKPAMIQKVENYRFDRNELVFGNGFFIEKNIVCMPLAMLNVFAMIDVQTGETVYQCGFGDVYLDRIMRTYLYTDCMRMGNKIFFSPTRANCIAVYDSAESTMEKLKTEIPLRFKKQIPNYSFMVKKDSNLYFIGAMQTNTIIEFNTLSGEFNYYGDVINQNSKLQNQPVYGRNAVIVEDILYIPLLMEGFIYEFAFQTKEERLNLIDDKKRALKSIDYYKGKFYITTEDGHLLTWHGRKMDEIKIPSDGNMIASLMVKEQIWLFPHNIDDAVVKVILDEDIKFETMKIPCRIRSVKKMDEAHILLHMMGGFIIMNIYDNQWKRISLYNKDSETPLEIIKKWRIQWNPHRTRYEGSAVYDTIQSLVEELREKT